MYSGCVGFSLVRTPRLLHAPNRCSSAGQVRLRRLRAGHRGGVGGLGGHGGRGPLRRSARSVGRPGGGRRRPTARPPPPPKQHADSKQTQAGRGWVYSTEMVLSLAPGEGPGGLCRAWWPHPFLTLFVGFPVRLPVNPKKSDGSNSCFGFDAKEHEIREEG